MTALAVAASLLIGVSLGILGGGSILTVPILVYLAGEDTKEATPRCSWSVSPASPP